MSTNFSRILLIINPVSGQGENGEIAANIERILEESEAECDIRTTRKEGDAFKWAKEAEGFDRILVGGGDGTIMEAMSGAIENPVNPPLAQIPLGTANLLARSLAVPTDLEGALELALNSGVSTAMDVGYLKGHRRYFAIVAGAGWDAEMIADADRELKDKLGFFAYVVTGFKHFFDLKRSHITATINGKRKRFWAHTLMVINIGEIEGTGLAIGKNVTPHDGKLNLAIVAMKSPMGIIRLLFRLLTKRFDGTSELRYVAVETLKIEANPPLKIEIDGEAIGETPFEIEIIPSGAHLIVPQTYAEHKKVQFQKIRPFGPKFPRE